MIQSNNLQFVKVTFNMNLYIFKHAITNIKYLLIFNGESSISDTACLNICLISSLKGLLGNTSFVKMALHSEI